MDRRFEGADALPWPALSISLAFLLLVVALRSNRPV